MHYSFAVMVFEGKTPLAGKYCRLPSVRRIRLQNTKRLKRFLVIPVTGKNCPSGAVLWVRYRLRQQNIISKGWGCAKSFSPPAAAKYSLDGGIFFLIFRSKIRKKMPPSKFNLARSAKNRRFPQPLKIIFRCGRRRKTLGVYP